MELQNQAVQEQQEEQNLQGIEDLAKKYLTKEALIRFGNIKTAFPEKANHISMMIAQLAQSGQLKEKITDLQLKEILKGLNQKKEINITRK